MMEAYEPGGKYAEAYEAACAKASDSLFKSDTLDFGEFLECYGDLPVSRLTIESDKHLIIVCGEIGEFGFSWHNNRDYNTGISFSYDTNFTLCKCFDFEEEYGNVWRLATTSARNV